MANLERRRSFATLRMTLFFCFFSDDAETTYSRVTPALTTYSPLYSRSDNFLTALAISGSLA